MNLLPPPPPKLPVGRSCIDHYRQMCRMPVFSHDELLCKMIAQPELLELSLLTSSAEDAHTMVCIEEGLRKDMLKKVCAYTYQDERSHLLLYALMVLDTVA